MKKVLSLVLSLSIMLSICAGLYYPTYASVIFEKEPNESVSDATTIKVGTTYSGEIGSYDLYLKRNHVCDVDYLKTRLEQGKEYTIKMTNYFVFFRDTTLLIELIDPKGKESSVTYYFEYDANEKVDSYSFTAEYSGDYYIKIFNYFDYDNKKPHYYSILLTDDKTQKIDKTKKPGIPKSVKVKAGKKSFNATWKTVKKVDGYEVQYSPKKNMKNAKIKTVKGATKKRIKVKKLKSKKTYYVRVRTFKTVGNKKLYGDWSAKKKVKVK